MTLLEPFRVQLQQDLAALEQAREVLAERIPVARHTIRSIAHSIQRSGITYGFPELSRASTELEEAPEDRLITQLDKLTYMVRRILETGHLPERKQALVIGEDPDFLEAVRTVLSSAFTDIHVVVSAADAAIEISRMDFDLVVLHLILPDTDGRQLVLQLRERYALNTVPIFVVAPKSSAFVRSECLTFGADEFFEQPLSINLFSKSLTLSFLQHETPERKSQRESRKDESTGFLQRAAFTRSFQRAKGLARSANFPLTFIRMSVDGLKKLSVQHTNLREEVLRRIAVLTQNFMQKSALRVRWDTDDLAILLLNTDIERARKRLEKVQAALAHERIPGVGTLTPSFSACIVDVHDATTLDEAIQRTDHLLHMAQSLGGNQIVSAPDAPEPARPAVVYAALSERDPASAVTLHHLNSQGMELALEQGPTSVIGRLLKTPPALAIIDLEHPHAQALIGSIRRHDAFRHTPILMLGEHSKKALLEQGFALGADDFLLKPFTPLAFLHRLHRLLRQQDLVALARESHPVPGTQTAKPYAPPAAPAVPQARPVTPKPLAPQPLPTPPVTPVPLVQASKTPAPQPLPGLTPIRPDVPMTMHKKPASSPQAAQGAAQVRFKGALAEAIRVRLTQGQAVHLPGLGELRIKHHLSTVKTESDGSVVVHPPANHVEFVSLREATSEVG